jgi:hypothetical protein
MMLCPAPVGQVYFIGVAVVDKYEIANQTTIERALDAAVKCHNGLPAETSNNNRPCFFLHDR